MADNTEDAVAKPETTTPTEDDVTSSTPPDNGDPDAELPSTTPAPAVTPGYPPNTVAPSQPPAGTCPCTAPHHPAANHRCPASGGIHYNTSGEPIADDKRHPATTGGAESNTPGRPTDADELTAGASPRTANEPTAASSTPSPEVASDLSLSSISSATSPPSSGPANDWLTAQERALEATLRQRIRELAEYSSTDDDED